MLIDPLNKAGYCLGGWHGEWVGPLDVPHLQTDEVCMELSRRNSLRARCVEI